MEWERRGGAFWKGRLDAQEYTRVLERELAYAYGLDYMSKIKAKVVVNNVGQKGIRGR